MTFRRLLFFFGIASAMPAVALTALAFVTPITVSGAFYLLGGWLVAVGLMLAPGRPRYHLTLTLSGLLVLLSVVGSRLNLAQSAGSNLRVVVLPAAKETRGVNWLIDEQDSVLFGEQALHLMGGVTWREHDTIVPAMSAAFAEARRAEGDFPSPFLSTYLGLQNSTAFDAVVIEPPAGQSASLGVVFLHGLMGNVTIQCRQIARAAALIDAVTVCPSTSWVGDWWRPQGGAILRETLRYLRGRGIRRVYLGGFSNGGSGIGGLSPGLASEAGLQGLFFIAGVRNGTGVRETHLPVLVIQGVHDERMPVEEARRFAGEIGNLATYVELEADHFLIMKHPQLVQDAVSAWLEGQALSK